MPFKSEYTASTTASGTGHALLMQHWKPGKTLLGQQNSDITTNYSAPEVEDLLDAVNKVCETNARTDYAETKNGQRVTRWP